SPPAAVLRVRTTDGSPRGPLRASTAPPVRPPAAALSPTPPGPWRNGASPPLEPAAPDAVCLVPVGVPCPPGAQCRARPRRPQRPPVGLGVRDLRYRPRTGPISAPARAGDRRPPRPGRAPADRCPASGPRVRTGSPAGLTGPLT